MARKTPLTEGQLVAFAEKVGAGPTVNTVVHVACGTTMIPAPPTVTGVPGAGWLRDRTPGQQVSPDGLTHPIVHARRRTHGRERQGSGGHTCPPSAYGCPLTLPFSGKTLKASSWPARAGSRRRFRPRGSAGRPRRSWPPRTAATSSASAATGGAADLVVMVGQIRGAGGGRVGRSPACPCPRRGPSRGGF